MWLRLFGPNICVGDDFSPTLTEKCTPGMAPGVRTLHILATPDNKKPRPPKRTGPSETSMNQCGTDYMLSIKTCIFDFYLYKSTLFLIHRVHMAPNMAPFEMVENA